MVQELKLCVMIAKALGIYRMENFAHHNSFLHSTIMMTVTLFSTGEIGRFSTDAGTSYVGEW